MKNTDNSGGTRYSEGKPGGWWFAPLLGLRLIAPVWEMGAAKYAPKDWQQGQSYSTLLDCAMRHMLQVMHRGVKARDKESGQLHLAHVGWNILCLLTFIELGRDDLDDTTKWNGITAGMRERQGMPYPPVPVALASEDRHTPVGQTNVERPIGVCHPRSRISDEYEMNSDGNIHTKDGRECCGTCIDDVSKQCTDCPLHSHEVHWLRAVLPIEEGPHA